ncbi:serine/threonine-protein kinase [Glycomyces sp. TRM65418]|uniref:serine/threonine-protein kinase n=1 Tax=Glycomyces sp. TRM65418 TaxID=2867006 RepID=UPI001CE5DDE4|nr:serine/threonine-protein kinase [Glycomyces sp. TRM65418]QZD55718.1 serine/threonine protein kinase [Glycomyces sp. TRM65418]
MEERLGSGSQGQVWRAADLRLSERPVALKRALSGGDAAAAAKVRREAEVLANINHPNVVTVYDAVEEDDDWWVVMEFVNGQTLAQLGTVAAGEAARYGAQLAGGLEAVHANGILHRDIKPANVMVTDTGHAKLADFGIARQVHAEPTLTGTGAVTGTPGYVAPEVVKGGRFTPAADVFSLGATLFHLIEGTSPFGEGNAHALLWRTAQGRRLEPERAGDLAPVLDRLLQADPKRRIKVEEARLALGELSGEPTIGARRRRVTRRRWIGAGAAAAALVVLMAAAWPVLGPGDDGGAGNGSPAWAGVDLIGEETTADPCALLDVEALAALGETRLDTDKGDPAQCNAVVYHSEKGFLDVELYFYSSDGEPPPGEATMVGSIGVIRYEGDHDRCGRQLVLPDGDHFVTVNARQDTSGEWDLCAAADVAADGAVAVLNQGRVPRREEELDADSLFRLDACELLDSEGLERFPGVDAHHPLERFGGWKCKWYSTTSDSELQLVLDRSDPPSADDGEPIELAGRDAIIRGEHWEAQSCMVSVVHRHYAGPDDDGTTTTEYLHVIVAGEDPLEELCDLAVTMAEPAAAALPPV